MNFKTAILKKKVELLLMFPFVILGMLAGKLIPLTTKHRHFLFFSCGDIGGSNNVNADIVELLKCEKPLVIFSKKPKNNGFLELFQKEGVVIIDLHRYIDIKALHFLNFFFRGVLAAWINKVENPVVFGGENMYFYKVIPHLKKSAKVIDLCHMKTWFNYSIAFVKNIDIRITSTPQIKRDLELVYQKTGVPSHYLSRLLFIDNQIDVPETYSINQNNILSVLFVGRGAPQKRVHLIAEVAKRMKKRNRPVHFSFVGDVEKIVPPEVQKYCTLYGSINDKKELNNIYDHADVLILTSAYEGLPLVVMEMMARGKLVLSTAVDGIPDYVIHRETGLLIKSKGESDIVEEAIEELEWLIEHLAERCKMGKNAFEFVQLNFSKAAFEAAYSEILS